MSHGLDSIGVEEHVALSADGADLADGLYRSDLVVGVHDRDENRLLGDRLTNIIGIDEAGGVYGEIGQLEAVVFEELRGVQDSVMLDGGGDYVIALLLIRQADSDEGLVVGLSAAAGEDDLFRQRANQCGDLLTRALHALARRLARGMEARRVAPVLVVVGQHRLHDLGPGRGGSGVIEVDGLHSGPPGKSAKPH